MNRPVVILSGPHRAAVSGVSTHVNLLMDSSLGEDFELVHFQVGSEGRDERGLGRWLRLASSPFALAAAVLEHGAEIVHLNTSLNARAWWRDLVYLLVAKACGARVVLQVHGGALERFAYVLRPALRWPDVVVVLSRREHESWRRLAPEQAVALVPNGIDCDPYLRHARTPPAPGDALRLVYMGRLAAEKGLEETIEGLAIARERGIAARLVVGGSGPEEARLRERVRKLALEAEVSFAGPVNGNKPALLADSDVLCLPSYSEGLPYALLEAMAAGVVPVVTRVGAIPDVVAEGAQGLFVPPRDAGAIADAIGELAADRERLARMGAACRRRIAAAYSIERVAGDFASLYSALCMPRERTWAP